MTGTRAAGFGLALLAVLLITGCGGGGAKRRAALNAERKAAIQTAHAKFSIAPCSLLTVGQVAVALGVHPRRQTSRAGCIYSGTTAGGDRRTLTVTPGAKPAGGQLVSPGIKHTVMVSGSGYQGRAGNSPSPPDVSVPTSAVAGVVSGNAYVALLVEDANPNAPLQLSRVVVLAQEAGKHLVTSEH